CPRQAVDMPRSRQEEGSGTGSAQDLGDLADEVVVPVKEEVGGRRQPTRAPVQRLDASDLRRAVDRPLPAGVFVVPPRQAHQVFQSLGRPREVQTQREPFAGGMEDAKGSVESIQPEGHVEGRAERRRALAPVAANQRAQGEEGSAGHEQGGRQQDGAALRQHGRTALALRWPLFVGNALSPKRCNSVSPAPVTSWDSVPDVPLYQT